MSDKYDYEKAVDEAGFSKFHQAQLRHYLRRFADIVRRDSGIKYKPDNRINEGVCGTCMLGAENCDVDLDGYCGGLK